MLFICRKRTKELVEQYKSIEGILKNIDKSKYIVPDDWKYKQARKFFLNPEVAHPETVEVNKIAYTYVCHETNTNKH